MSHQPERKEKNCLNCGTIVAGYYCQQCGQPNIITKQSFWGLAKHFVYDVLHFDGKFFITLKELFSRPGFVARQYVEGKRARYLDPIRMYLFTSAIFFLVLFAIASSGKEEIPVPLTMEERQEWKKDLLAELAQNPYDTSINTRIALLDSLQRPVFEYEMHNIPVLKIRRGNYSSIAEYDSAQSLLPPGDRDGWIIKRIMKKTIDFNARYKGREAYGNRVLIDYFLHQFPYLLFFSLPFFALILKLVYLRRKELYYSDHAIFTLFHYILSFLLLLLLFGFDELKDLTGWSLFRYLMLGSVITWFIYFFLELKYFYRQGWRKTIMKFMLINMIGLVLLIILIVLFFLLSLYKI